MRLSSLITALVVAVAVYLVILERETLRALANGEPPAAGEPAPIADPANDPVSVVVERFTARPVQSGIRLNGRTEAARQVEVRAETTGQVISEPRHKGTEIAAGEVLCELDPGTRRASLAEARAALREAQTNVTTAEKLSERGFTAETDLIAKQAALESAQARVEQAEKELERLKITAPFDGVLETDTAELGSLLQPGSACATLIALDPIRLVGFVPEQTIGRLSVGNPAGARLVDGQDLRGTVSFLARSADPATRTFRVEVTVPNPDWLIRDGLTAEIVIGLAGEQGHLIPQSALTLNDAGTLGVRVNDDGTAQFMPARMIRDTPDGAWVGDLPETVEIIVTGQDFVQDGRPIDVTYREARQ